MKNTRFLACVSLATGAIIALSRNSISRRVMPSGALILLVGLLAQAQAPPAIISFSRNGQLTWTDNDYASSCYTVEWSSDLGDWTNSWDGLRDITTSHSSNTVSVPMFYRVVKNPKTLLSHVYVDPVLGDDTHDGTEAQPRKTISAALSLLPEEIAADVTVHLKAGNYTTTGASAMPDNYLVLRRRMWPGVIVQILGDGGTTNRAVLDWSGREFLVLVLEGQWSLANLQIGTRRPGQPEGLGVEGPGLAIVRDVRIRTGTGQAAGLLARRAGRIHLYGTIEMNEDLHDAGGAATNVCMIWAKDHGTIQFMQSVGASLSMGNGQLAASSYGSVGLGCGWAKITSWTTGNNIAIACSGRVDLHGTETTLRGRHPDNGLIGLEDDGHVLAENTHVILESLGCRDAIYLQKASMVFGGPFEVRGAFTNTVAAMSGSVFGGTVTGAVSHVEAHTGAHITLEHGSSMPRTARGWLGGTVVLPNDRVLIEEAFP